MRERGIHPVFLVHNTYLVDAEFISKLSYEGAAGSFEFTNFSVSAKTQGITQYICNHKFYGWFLHFWKSTENEVRLLKDCEEKLNELMDCMLADDNQNVQRLLKELNVSEMDWMKAG